MWYANFITEMKKSIYTEKLCVQLYALLNLALCGREWSASHSVCFICFGQRLGEPHCWSGQGDEYKVLPLARTQAWLLGPQPVTASTYISICCMYTKNDIFYQWLTLLSLSGSYIKPWISRIWHPWMCIMWCVIMLAGWWF